MENKMIAVCGLDCAACDAFIATKSNDDTMKAKVAAEWSKMNGADIKPEDIICEGCRTGSSVLGGYCSMCEIRKCAAEKQVSHCGICTDFPCEKVSMVLDNSPTAAENLKSLL